MKLLKSEEWEEDMGGRIFVSFKRNADGSIAGAPIDVCFANGYMDEGINFSEYTHFIDDNCNSLFTSADPVNFPSYSANEPKIGEWWMCKSKDTFRMCPMVRVKKGWGSISNAEGKPLNDFVQDRPIFDPLFKMVPA